MWTRWLVLFFFFSPGRCSVRIGRALSVFRTFGDLGPSLIARDSREIDWMADPDSVDVFEEIYETRRRHFSPKGFEFGGDFQLELCDDLIQLESALFRPYKVEGCEKPWRLFSGGWSRAATALRLGLENSSYISPPYAYALARLTRPSVTVSLSPNYDLRLNNRTRDLLTALASGPGEMEGEWIEAVRVLREIGSHYVASYTTGETIFQVFVFSSENYIRVQKVLLEYQQSGEGIGQVLKMFKPKYVGHFGRIITSSKNATLEWWLAWQLRGASLLSLSRDPSALRRLDQLLGETSEDKDMGNREEDNEEVRDGDRDIGREGDRDNGVRYIDSGGVLVSADLRSLPSTLSGDEGQILAEALANQMRLWELNV